MHDTCSIFEAASIHAFFFMLEGAMLCISSEMKQMLHSEDKKL